MSFKYLNLEYRNILTLNFGNMVERFQVNCCFTVKRFHARVISSQLDASLCVICPPKHSSVQDDMMFRHHLYIHVFALMKYDIISTKQKSTHENRNMTHYSKLQIRVVTMKNYRKSTRLESRKTDEESGCIKICCTNFLNSQVTNRNTETSEST